MKTILQQNASILSDNGQSSRLANQFVAYSDGRASLSNTARRGRIEDLIDLAVPVLS